MNKSTKKIDFSTNVYDDTTEIVAFPYEAVYFAAGAVLPSMQLTTSINLVNVSLEGSVEFPEYLYQEHKDDMNNKDDKDDNFVLVIKKSDNTVDWKATFGDPSVSWDYTTHYIFPPLFFMFRLDDATKIIPDANYNQEWDLHNPLKDSSNNNAWDPMTFGFNHEDMSDLSGVVWDNLPNLKISIGQ